MKPIPDNAIPCSCGKGYIADCADGMISCTHTITKYEATHGPFPCDYTVRTMGDAQVPCKTHPGPDTLVKRLIRKHYSGGAQQ